jgi:myo-inositol-1(or 4)-monophosphatase
MAKDEALQVALRLARRLKRTANAFSGAYSEDVRFGLTGDATYEVDEPVEEAVGDFFSGLKIPCRVITEDAGAKDFGEEPEYVFLIDPLDGSRNARRGLPFHCCSLAVYDAGAKELSDARCAVIERFDADEEFVAVRGKGATLNGKRMRPSAKTTLDDAVLDLGCHFAKSYGAYSEIARRLGAMVDRDERNILLKSYGSTALELAYLAAGRIDLLCEIRASTAFKAAPKTYDIAAGVLLCAEAGAPIQYGSQTLPEQLPIDPTIRVQVVGAGNSVLFNTLKDSLR